MIGHPTPASPPGDPTPEPQAPADPPGPTASPLDAAQHVIVSVDDQHLAHMDTVVAGLQGVGMVIEDVMTGIGMISGSVPNEEGTQTVVHVVGVASVQRQLTYRLPPPEADVQ